MAEGSPQGLALTPSVGSPRFPVPSSPYQAPDPQHRQSSYRGVESDTTPFHPAYSASNYPVSPTGTFTGNSHSYQTTGTSQFSSCSSWTSSLTADLLPSEAQVIPGPDMSFAYSMQAPLPGSHQGQRYDPTMATAPRGYFPETQSRTPSLPSSYVDPGERQYPHSRQDYAVSSSPAYNSRSYPPVYSMSTVNPTVYSGPSPLATQIAPSIPVYPHHYQSGPRSSPNQSISSHSEQDSRAESSRAIPGPGGARERPQCWEHGCNGREFSTFSNLLRHQREKSGTAAKSYCPNCNAEFTRTTARNGHMEHGKCKPRRSSDDR